jgi:hypothetical protein
MIITINYLNHINVVTVIMIGLFLAPVAVGIISPFQDLQLQRFISSLLNNIINLVSIILSIYLTSLIRSDNENKFLIEIYKIIPPFQNLVTSRNIWINIIFVLLLTVPLAGLLHLLIMPVNTYCIAPMINKVEDSFRKKSGLVRRIVLGLCQLPRSIIYVIAFSLLMNFCTNYNSGLVINEKINQSVTYQFVNKNVLNPLLSSSIVKKIPVLLNDSFKDASTSLQNTHLIQYFNGMTLDNAVKSDSEIDSAAKEIVGKETNSKEKAYLIYRWVCKNISYDNNKAAIVATDPSRVSSGAIVAFNTRAGICFDYACLYVAMCRAVNVKVRFITGMGYSGVEWGDHAWNQVYYPAENRWISVDTTFGNSGKNYFDLADFSKDHQNAVIQGEW